MPTFCGAKIVVRVIGQEILGVYHCTNLIWEHLNLDKVFYSTIRLDPNVKNVVFISIT